MCRQPHTMGPCPEPACPDFDQLTGVRSRRSIGSPVA